MTTGQVVGRVLWVALAIIVLKGVVDVTAQDGPQVAPPFEVYTVDVGGEVTGVEGARLAAGNVHSFPVTERCRAEFRLIRSPERSYDIVLIWWIGGRTWYARGSPEELTVIADQVFVTVKGVEP